ncbi:glycosyl transferase family protein [Francisellaceae bacterium]|nr:glycosyl transferase family protein [Francisellaceae bacterium]
MPIEIFILSLEAGYWFFIQILLYISAVFIFLSSLDDLFIDIYFWTRKIILKFKQKKGDVKQYRENILAAEESPIALMIPAWSEWNVIGKMLDACVSRFKYQNYKIFVGTYPNDEKTQQVVDEAAKKYPQVVKVITKNPGPSTKADCLNNVISQIFNYETEHKMRFSVIMYHDAEDVVHPLELKLFNYQIPEYDMVQLPVFPLKKRWYNFTCSTYMDEFAEYHSKDVIVRESITGNVCSAGVGTAFSRKAIMTLYSLNHGQVFDESSLTEDYEMSYRLHEQGLKEHFELLPTPEDNIPYLAVQAYFPDKMSKAIRQKSRWMIGIMFQGWKSIGWPWKRLGMLYFLFRDRKGVVSNLVNIMAYFIVINVVFDMFDEYLFPSHWHFPSVIPYGTWVWDLVLLNGVLFLNRMFQRLYFITTTYGFMHGLLSIPRLFLANIINFCAYIRAIFQVKTSKKSKPVAWDKTDHEFPDL